MQLYIPETWYCKYQVRIFLFVFLGSDLCLFLYIFIYYIYYYYIYYIIYNYYYFFPEVRKNGIITCNTFWNLSSLTIQGHIWQIDLCIYINIYNIYIQICQWRALSVTLYVCVCVCTLYIYICIDTHTFICEYISAFPK